MAENEVKDIGVDVDPPESQCDDENCPFHGTLSVRGQQIEGTVKSKRMDGSAIIEKDHLNYVPKYERYEKRSGNYPAHVPPCIDLERGDRVKIMECRPLSKSVSYVLIEGEKR